MHGKLRIAIIDENTVTCIGLRSLLSEVVPFAELCIYGSFDEFMKDNPEDCFHYFISSSVLFLNNSYFVPREKKTIVMASGGDTNNITRSFRILDLSQPEEELVKSILSIHQGAHHHGYHTPDAPVQTETPRLLSLRESEVLQLVVKGLINKEIADRLHISVTTVITHRRNITEKLGIKSVSGLTIYAVTHGYVDIEKL
ncbi:MAG: response regulator transcription factor [Bacteroidales bacterium]|nr:response regulator transcription factor [Bacteroidales bacterium]